MKETVEDEKSTTNHIRVRREAALTVCEKIADSSPLSRRVIGTWVRAYHYSLPLLIFLSISFSSKGLSDFCIAFLAIVLFMYVYFGACLLSLIEKRFCKDDDNISDWLIQMSGREISRDNRYMITRYYFFCYLTFVAVIYYFRFLNGNKLSSSVKA